MDGSLLIWQQPEIIRWSQILANSYQRLLGKKMLDTVNTPEALAQALFNAPFLTLTVLKQR